MFILGQIFFSPILNFKQISERPIDLSSLLYENSIMSRLVYSLCLFSSFSSVGISCARILKCGEYPVIVTFVSFRFLKILLLLVSRFLVQSYVLAMAVKSLMYWFVSHYQYFKPGQSGQFYLEIENLYYRGICWPSKSISTFCYNTGPEILTFQQATLYAPLFLISMVFFPSILYILIINVNIFGFKKFFEKFFENPLLFIFPLFTSFSFNKIVEKTPEDITQKKNKIRANSMPLINSIEHSLEKGNEEVFGSNLTFETETSISKKITGFLISILHNNHFLIQQDGSS